MRSSGQTYWRYRNRPRSVRARRVIVLSPEPGTLAHNRQIMKQVTETALASGLPRPLIPFEASDIAMIHTQRHGEPGIWFRLHDDRVFTGGGEPESSDPDDYELRNVARH